MKLELNEYQATNLRWLLALIHDNQLPQGLHTGDWCGELRWAVEQLMIDHEVKQMPNAEPFPGFYWPKLQGWHNGQKSA